ncbi:mitochondrial 54S ribosomal protein uL6m [Lipomyces oligophaga]|uniref:mitochondrial 54S ribosomal protein uL6m n=1 Tax=Lipomyces oligophaga TaxID=45792 RepID=UPI0034CDA25A
MLRSSRIVASFASSRPLAQRSFSVAAHLQSHIGSSPIFIPESVELALDVYGADLDTHAVPLVIKGPNGVGRVPIDTFARLNLSADGKTLSVSVENSKDGKQREMWGTLRSLIQNYVTGVTEGHIVLLTFVGTGYRYELAANGKEVNVKVGQTGTTKFVFPEGVTAVSPSQTRLMLRGHDKHVVTLFAARIRSLRPPEPYKGKGIFVNNETIKLKGKNVK